MFGSLWGGQAVAGPLDPYEPQEGEMLMPQFGCNEVTVWGDTVIYDFRGPETSYGAEDGYGEFYSASSYVTNGDHRTAAALRIKAGDPSKLVVLTFEYVEMIPDDGWGYYPAFLNVYDGSSFDGSALEWPTSGNQVEDFQFPEGEIASISGEVQRDFSYTASSSQGLVIGLLWANASRSDGFKATVRCVDASEIAPISLSAAGSFYTRPDEIYAGMAQVNLLSFYAEAKGMKAGDTLTSVRFKIEGETGIVNTATLKLYSGLEDSYAGQQPLEATFSQDGTEWVCTFCHPLIEGRQEFGIAADMTTDASLMGKSCTVSLTGVATKAHAAGVGGDLLQPASEIPALTLAKMIVMPSAMPDPIPVYTIDGEYAFYDAGGPQGDVEENFEGAVTFVPAIEGQVIQLDFSKIEIQNYSGLMANNDILKVYNGRNVEESNLHTAVSDEKTLIGSLPMRLRSTAEDGSLTVYFKKVAGLSKPGFEATVSQYQPADMRFVSANQFFDPAIKTLQGDTLLLLGINIRTEDLNNPLSLQSLDLDFSDCSPLSLVESGKVYSMGQDSVFDAAKAVEAGSFVNLTAQHTAQVQIDASKARLLEGSNYFYVTVAISYDAKDGDYLRAVCTSLTLSDGQGSHAPSALPQAGSIKVENIYYSQEGEHIQRYKNSMGFRPTSASYSAYDPYMGEQVVTFVPVTEGRMTQIEFSLFDLYAGGSYYGTPDVFEIYSGGRDGELLWEYDGEEATLQGPASRLRSKAADGSMTIVFEPKGGSSYYVGDGFEALLTEYEPAVLDIDTAAGFQATAGDLMPGVRKQPVIGLRMEVFGTLDQLAWTGLTANWKNGSEQAVEYAYLYMTRTAEFDTLQKIAESTVTSAKTAFYGTSLLEEGTYYIWLCADIDAKAESGTALDASWSGLATSLKGSYPIGDADPEGEILLTNMYKLQNGQNGEVLVDGSLMFYDDGGKDGAYTRDAFNGKVTFAPAVAGQVIRARFESFETYSTTHILSVYSGSDTLAQDRIGAYSYRTYPQIRLMSQSPDGKMTFQFIKPRSSYGSMPDGWAIEISAVNPSPLALAGVDAEAVAQDFVGAGSQNVQALLLRLQPVGDTGAAVLTDMVFDLASTDVDLRSIRAYFLETDTVLNMAVSADCLFAQVDSVKAGTSSLRLSGSASMRFEQDYYMVVCYDLGDVEVGGRIEMALDSAYAGGRAVPVRSETASHTVRAGIHGDFIVGVSAEADFATIQEAVDYLSIGVDGPVNLRLESGTYDEVVVVPAIAGLSEQNLLTLSSLSGRAEDVIIASDDYDEYLDYATLTRNPNEGVFNLAGTSYLRLQDVTLTTDNMEFPSVVHAYDGAHHLDFSGLRILAGQPTDYNSTIDLLVFYASSTRNPRLNCSHIQVRDCYFEGGDIGLNLGGSGVVTLGKNAKVREAVIEGNEFVNQGSKGVYLHDVEHFRFAGNTVRTDFVYSYSYDGMDVYRCGSASEISGNRIEIDLPTGKYATGIYSRPVYGEAEAPMRIFNNVVDFRNTLGTSYGIEMSGFGTGSTTSHVDIAYNTVRLGGESEASGSAALYIDDEAAPSALYIANNLFQNRVGGYVYRLDLASDTAHVDWERNGVFTTADTIEDLGIFARLGSTEISYAVWDFQVKSDKESLFAEAEFLSSNFLGLKNLHPFDTAISLDWVPTDILGIDRPATRATLGAYEFEGDLNQPPVMADGYPILRDVTAFTADVAVKPSQSSRIYYAVAAPGEKMEADSVVSQGMMAEVGRNQEAVCRFENLQAKTWYQAYFVMENFNKVRSGLIVSDSFQTDFLPTAVSTFEDVAVGVSEKFEDGTALFSGFKVVDADAGVAGAPEGSHRALALGDARIEITNTDTGLNLTGFFYRSKAESVLRLSNGRELTVPASDGWRYFNLRDKGRMTYLEFSCTDSLYMDDFSGQPFALQLGGLPADTVVKRGTELALAAAVSGGVPEYAYSWMGAAGDTVGREAVLEVLAERSAEYTLYVRDEWNSVQSVSVQVVVLGGEGIADFEDLDLEAESSWHGDTDGDTYFYSGSYRFTNSYTLAWDSWMGFSYANISDSTYIPEWGYDNQYKNAAGGGALGSATYGVVYDHGVVDLLEAGEEGAEIPGCYVTNNIMLYNAAVNGDTYSGGPFESGDYFKVFFRGIRPDGDTAVLEYYLADYRDADSAERYILNTWEWVDLSGLGAVKQLLISFEGSRENQYGPTLPLYMAIDKIGVARPEARVIEDSLLIGTDALLAFEDVFSLSGTGRWDVVAGEPDVEGVASFAVTDSGLQVSALGLGTCQVELQGIRNGRSEYVVLRLEVVEDAGVEDRMEVSGSFVAAVYPVPAVDYVNVRLSAPVSGLQVVNLQGRTMYEERPASFHAGSVVSIPVSGWSAGIYFLCAEQDGIRQVLKFVVR